MRSPKRQDSGFSEHTTSSRSKRQLTPEEQAAREKRRAERTPEEQAAHDKRKEERRQRAREAEKALEDAAVAAPTTPTKSDKGKDRSSAPRESRELASEHRRSSRRHSRSSVEPKLDTPSPVASKKFFDMKNGESIIEPNFTLKDKDREVPTSAAASSSKIPDPKRASTSSRLRRSEDKIGGRLTKDEPPS